ncbi:MAG: hypothetical protein GY801_01755 [bacterium]|nr:hypothetical protein [bacterium]
MHEYKPQRHKAPDPWGQVLVAMVAAQKLNQNDKPMYGAYVMGRNWYFVVLHGATHVGSLAYDATKEDDLRQIFKMLNEIHQTDDRAGASMRDFETSSSFPASS